MQETKISRNPGIISLYVSNAITRLLLGAITVICCLYGLNARGSDSFKQHIYLCVVGYILLMAESSLVFSEYNGWSSVLSYKDKKNTHLVLHLVGCALVTAGSIIRIQGWPGTTFSTWHGITGFIALLLTAIGLLGGLVIYFLNLPTKLIKIFHAFFGCLTLLFAFVSLGISYTYPVFKQWMNDTSVNVMIVLTAISMLGIVISYSASMVKKLK